MNNQNYNQRPGYPPYQYGYNYQHPYSPMAPYPSTAPYGMPTPMPAPMPNYSYYPPTMVVQHEPPSYPASNSPMYAPNYSPYSQTRMASPSPYAGYNPPPQPPNYNYNTTNMISRPTRPNLYPQLSQLSQNHTYPPMPTNTPNPANNNTGVNIPPVLKSEPSRDSVESNVSWKSADVSIICIS